MGDVSLCCLTFITFLLLLKMRYVAAYLLAVLGGNDNPSAADIEKILGSVGIDVDKERLSKVISELKGKDINEVSAHRIIVVLGNFSCTIVNVVSFVIMSKV